MPSGRTLINTTNTHQATAAPSKEVSHTALKGATMCAPAPPIDFNLQIKPILSDRCFKCHGPDKNKVKAGLQLTSFEGATQLLKSGKRAVVPGKPEESELVARIHSKDPDEMMPSPESNLSLSESEKELLVQWIAQGAVYQEHWAFVPPVKRPLPAARPGAEKLGAIDRFIEQKLQQQGLTPAPEAGRETLIRRLSFDLTGLPPTPEAVRAFVDNPAPDAYEQLVDQLLASPHFGERMALDWLDVARYADSHGYQDDGLRNAYPYRDWVIRAFNQNLPFDQFVSWQLGGDLLPNPTRDQLTATCFNRNHMQTQEGGVVAEEYRTEYVADRANTFGKAFLGLTLECARCHTHKYDPIEHKEYYSLFAFFNSNQDFGIVPYSGEAAPTLLLTSAAAQKSVDSLRALMAPRLQKTAVSEAYKQDFEQWLSTLKNREQPPAHPYRRLVYVDFETPADSIVWDAVNPPTAEELKKRAEAAEKRKKENKMPEVPAKLSGFLNRDTSRLTRAAVFQGDKDRYPLPTEGKWGKGLHFRGDAQLQLGRALRFEKNEAFSVSIWFKLLKSGEYGPIFGKSNGDFEGYRGYLCKLNKDGTLSFQLNHVWPANGIDLQTTVPIRPQEWIHLAMVYDGSSQASGLRVYLNGARQTCKIHADNLQRSILHSAKPNYRNWSDQPFLLGAESRESLQHADMDELQVWHRPLSDLEVQGLYENRDVVRPLALKPERSEKETLQLLEHYLWSGQNAIFNENMDSLIALRGWETEILTNQEEVMIMKEDPFPPQSYVLQRGAYDAPGEAVTPGTPVKLLPFDRQKYPPNRLGLAQWLLDENNPLFARVMANRYWMLLFGRGLVRTQEDFGNQGDPPTHPELLDWLALDFREHQWDLKRFIRQIVCSATYRRSSVPTPAQLEKDLLNDLYARYPAHRLSAELIRDNALAASGLLVPKIGGPSVYPYQPEGIWEALATRNAVKYMQNHGDSLYRRSLYTIWKRSAPPPAMLNFDATDRAFCSVRRQKTSSPLQVLVLMNDPQFVEAARVLGEKMMAMPDANARIQFAFWRLVGRAPRTSELLELRRLYDNQLAHYKQTPQQAAALLDTGEFPRNKDLRTDEMAACTIVASTLMGFDEFSMKR